MAWWSWWRRYRLGVMAIVCTTVRRTWTSYWVRDMQCCHYKLLLKKKSAQGAKTHVCVPVDPYPLGVGFFLSIPPSRSGICTLR
jgi:hypothetical protein